MSNRRTARTGWGRRLLLGRAAALVGAAIVPWRTAEAAHMVRAWPADRPIPPLDLVDLDGKRWRLDALAGQVVVLNFWATWCEPCRVEMPSLAAMAARRKAEGVRVIAVNYLEAADIVRRFVERSPFRPTILLDSDGDATVAWTPRVFPSTVLIGRGGRPEQTVIGELDWESGEAHALLDPLVARPGKY